MIVALLAIGLVIFLVIAIIGKMFVAMLSVGLLFSVGALFSFLRDSISKKQFIAAGGVGLAIAAASFLLLL